MSEEKRTAYGIKAGIIGIVANLIISIAKLIVGFLANSISISADAANNLSDAASSLVTLLGAKLSSLPADDKHPYGHHRIEYLSSLGVSAIILVIGFELAKDSIEGIIHPHEIEFSWVIIAVLVFSIIVKLGLSSYLLRIGKLTESNTITASGIDSRNDVIATLAILISTLVGHYTGLKIDGYVGLLVSLLIIKTGGEIALETISTLIGNTPEKEQVDSIVSLMRSNPTVLGVHDLIIHDYGPGRIFASAHAEINYKQNVLYAHEVIDTLERRAKDELKIDLTIHYDPIVIDDEEVNKTREILMSAVENINPVFKIHDFRMVRADSFTNLIFDMVIPHEYDRKTEEIKKQLEEELSKTGKKYYCVITFDSSSFN